MGGVYVGDLHLQICWLLQRKSTAGEARMDTDSPVVRLLQWPRERMLAWPRALDADRQVAGGRDTVDWT